MNCWTMTIFPIRTGMPFLVIYENLDIMMQKSIKFGLYDTLSKKYKTKNFGDYVLNDRKVASYVVNKSSKVDVKT